MSAEHRGPPGEVERLVSVVHLYRLLLRRTADRGGLLHHAERLDRGEGLDALARSLLHTDEGRAAWAGLAPVAVALRIWRSAGGAPDRFDAAWTQAAADVPVLVAGLVRDAGVRDTPILEALFPAGIDPADDDVYPGWAYRLWAAEAGRALSDAARRLFPVLRAVGPRIGLVVELGPGDRREQLDITLASLSGQIYGRWRLVLRGSLPDGFLLPRDPRIVAVAGAEDSLPPARWIGRLRAGDALSSSALALLAFAICRRPWIDGVGCDEDRRREDGTCVDPVLTSGGSRLTAERLCQVPGFVIRRSARRGRRGGEAAAGRLARLPAILCHRLVRFGPPVPEERAAAEPTPPVSVVIATRDRAELLERCIRSLRACTDYPALEVVLVDNGSTDAVARALLDRLGEDGCRVLDRPGPFNWSALNNDGVAAATGEIVVLMNNDVDCVEPGWLRAMVRACLLPGAGAVGAVLRYGDGTVQHAGVVLGPGPQAAHLRCDDPRLPPLQEVPAVTGACLAMRRMVFERIGGLDPALPVTWNDLDLCLRLRGKGFRVLLARDAVLLHDELGSRTPDSDPGNRRQLERSRMLVASRHRAALRRERFLHPLLTLDSGGCCLDPAAPRRTWMLVRGGGRVLRM